MKPGVIPSLLISGVLVLSSCQEKKLVKTTWTVLSIEYKGKPVPIQANEISVFGQDGQLSVWLDFRESGRITLPGIWAHGIEATWTIDNGYITFKKDADLSGVEDDEADISFLSADDSSNLSAPDSSKPEDDEPQDTTGGLTLTLLPPPQDDKKLIKAAMKIYEGPFRFDIHGDTLFLRSEDATLIARKVTLQELVNGHR